MHRRDLFRGAAGALLSGRVHAEKRSVACGCGFQVQAATPGAFDRVGSRLRVTGMKVFGVTLNSASDRPYVFVKLETNQGIVGWGEGTLEGKAGAVIACVNDVLPAGAGFPDDVRCAARNRQRARTSGHGCLRSEQRN